ncbi:MAG: peptidylprolyl isomerase [Candidatus Gastranaerophilales bacterium]|nr:peptidylprolyl isomerase [Candidatus Gastranaerophilales bacterium]
MISIIGEEINMKKITLFVLTMSLALIAGCSKGPFKKVDTSEPLIKVNTAVITQNTFDETFENGIKNLPIAGKNIDIKNPKNKFMYLIYKDRTVKELIVKELINQEAQKRKISVTDKDVNKTIDEIAQKLGGKDKLESSLTLNNIKKEDLINNIKMDLVTKKLIENVAGNLSASDKEIKDFYEKNKTSKFTNPDLVRASHILINTQDTDIKRAKSNAEKILTEVKANPANFDAIAKKNSEDVTTAPKGGDLGFFSKKDMVPAFAKAAFSMTPGTISGIVKTQFGFHIIKVTDRKKAGLIPFAEVKSDIGIYLSDRKKITVMQKLIEGAKNSAKIEYVDAQYNPDSIAKEIKEIEKNKKMGLTGMPPVAAK